MTGMALIRPVGGTLWDLRAAWATGRRIAVTLERADVDRVEGHISTVSATGAAVTVAGLRVPTDRILAVHYPSRLGDSTARDGDWAGMPQRVEQIPGQIGWDELGRPTYP